MRQGPNGRRPRGRPNRKQHGGPSRPNSFDSSGPEGRIRGNAHQVYEKYVALARDAISAGDRVSAETYYQHAEHYFRIVNSSTDPETMDRRPPRHDGSGRDAGGRERGGRDLTDGGSTGRGPDGQDTRPQDARPQETRPQETRAQDADEAAPGPARARGADDREGLDRVLGKDSSEPQRRSPRRTQSPDPAATDGPSDRDTGQPSTRRRPRQRPARTQEADAQSEGTERSGPQASPRPGRAGNGQDQAAAPAPDPVSAAPSEPAEATATGEKNPDTEPAGA